MELTETDDSEFMNNVINNMMDLFFNPEIKRRKEQKLIPEDFILTGAQAIFFPDGREHIVRLNNEILVEAKLKKRVDKNVTDFRPAVADIEYLKLKESEYLNCGHSTLILVKDGYLLSFDFQYNKQICAEHLRVASQFLKSSKYALEVGLISPFIENSFSTIELLAKTSLFYEANQSVQGKTHRTVKSAFNLRYKHSQSELETKTKQVFNQLLEARDKARYSLGSINMDEDELQSIYETIEAMYNELYNRARFDKE